MIHPDDDEDLRPGNDAAFKVSLLVKTEVKKIVSLLKHKRVFSLASIKGLAT